MEEEEEELVFKSDHEFSPESDVEEEEAVPVKRARTAIEEKQFAKEQKQAAQEAADKEKGEEKASPAEESEEVDETTCEKCGHQDHPETILLCDLCDHGWHLSCLRPPLLAVPEGEWVCPDCQHLELILKLKQLLNKFDATQKRAESLELQKQRLEFVNISLQNVVGKKKREGDGYSSSDDGSSSGSDSSSSDDSSSSSDDEERGHSDSSGPLYTLRARRSQPLKQKFETFDELIDDAIRDEMEAAAGAGNAGRGKDIENILQAEREEEDDEPVADDAASLGDEAEKMSVDGDEIKKEDKHVEFAKEEEKKQDSDVDKKDDDDKKPAIQSEKDDDDDEEIVAPKRKKKIAVKDSDDEVCLSA